VLFGDRVVADSTRAVRVLEPTLPPAWYIPPEDVKMDLLRPSDHRTVCEWKGVASYWSLVVGDRTSPNCAWSYPQPTPAFQTLRDYLAFYANRVDACFVDDERVQAQKSDFYGGWVTEDVVLDRGDG
jgi:uncharacterized protein (DUF427 family)